MSNFTKLKANAMVSSFLYGEDTQKTQDYKHIYDMVKSICPVGNKDPESHALVHTTMVVLRERGFKIESTALTEGENKNEIHKL